MNIPNRQEDRDVEAAERPGLRLIVDVDSRHHAVRRAHECSRVGGGLPFRIAEEKDEEAHQRHKGDLQEPPWTEQCNPQ